MTKRRVWTCRAVIAVAPLLYKWLGFFVLTDLEGAATALAVAVLVTSIMLIRWRRVASWLRVAWPLFTIVQINVFMHAYAISRRWPPGQMRVLLTIKHWTVLIMLAALLLAGIVTKQVVDRRKAAPAPSPSDRSSR
jgi:hypothetical protein